MTCAQAEDHLLESLDEPLPPDVRRAVDLHVASCPGCAAFAARLRAIDAQLAAALLLPISAPASVAAGVRRQQRSDRAGALAESLPDVIHLAGCGAATVVSAALLPVEATMTLSVGIAFTCFSYVLMAIVRSSLDAAEPQDW